jgi:hypothetical protein
VHVRRLPKTLTRRFQVMVLADTAFGSVEFLQGSRKLRNHAVVGVRRDRKLVDGRKYLVCTSEATSPA